MTRRVLAVCVAACFLAAPLSAQQPTARQVDSLAAQVRALKARLDSALALLANLQARGPAALAAPAAAKDTAGGDDLAALRAAASAASGGGAAAKPDSNATDLQFVGRERNQNQLNPEISVTGDVRAYATSPGPQRDNFDPREFEIGFQSALDPYSSTKIFVSLENGEVSVEEGYASWTGLPGHIRLDVGKFRQPFGELNRWHLHAVPEAEYPLVIRSFLGADGLSGAGLSFYHAFDFAGTNELTLQVTRSNSDSALFDGGRRPTYLAHLLNFWQLSRSTYVQLGGTVLYGSNADSALKTTVGGLDFRLTWRPPAQALYREWTLRGEVLALSKRTAGSGRTRLGGYASTTYKLGRRWIAGLRFDSVEEPTTGFLTRQVVPSLTLWESEWVFLRAQYQWQQISTATPTHQLALQAVWAIGPHKHETY